MKSIRVSEFGGPEVLRLEETADLQPGPGQVVVRVHAAGVNPVETYVRSGKYPKTPPLPYTPGTDAAGVVEKIGPNVSRVKPGDRVYTSGSLSGTYAEQALCSESDVHPLPDSISFEQGAAINIPYATAYRALFQRARAQAGDTVLIHGATGGVGIAAIQFACAAGLRVIGTAGSDRGRVLVLQHGAHFVLDHHAAGYLDEALRLTQGQGFDVILEMLANINLGHDLSVLARSGRVVIIGSRGTVEINPRDLMGRESAILGMVLFNATARDLFSIHSAIGSGLRNRTLSPVVGRTFPLTEASRAHEAVMEPGAFGKIALIP